VRETALTRPTVNAIFKALKDKLKSKLLENPEGFANVFISVINGALADHVAGTILNLRFWKIVITLT
jgi:hypothetical protein